MRRRRSLFVSLTLLCLPAAGIPPGELFAATPPESATLRAWVEELKVSPKGPFDEVRWFCNDGTILPPHPYACREHGGGVQHGTWNERALALRHAGYRIANVLVALDPDDFVGEGADIRFLKELLVERFLIGWDDGWIFRGARSYRGALQIEDESARAREIVLALLVDRPWRRPERFLLLRETVRLLPLEGAAPSAAHVRQLALSLAEEDPGFMALRVKIHGLPDPGDAERVRAYASERGMEGLKERYGALASAIEELYERSAAASVASLAAESSDSELARTLREGARELEAIDRPAARLAAASRLLGLLRQYLPGIERPESALAALETSLALESEVYAAGATLLPGLGSLTRRESLSLLDSTAEALYGVGFLSSRHLAGIKASLARLEETGEPSLAEYREALGYLARAPEWSSRWLEFHFGPTVEQLAAIEPQAHLYPQDRLRGSPLLVYGAVIDTLVLDANRLAGIEHELFGERIGAGLRALNPGLARGVLRAPEEGGFESDGIYLLPETTSDLPPVAGILTRGEGSSLSHVQLLARNLGIPNVVVGEELLAPVRERLGTRVVLAVSPKGVVRLVRDSSEWDAVFGAESAEPDVEIRPDLKKLDLHSTALVSLSSLRASDSGRTSGPKGANLGELKHHFGDRVPDGFVVPFGVFRAFLDRPLEPGGPAVFEWMQQRYASIAEAPAGSEEQRRRVTEFLARLRSWIRSAPLPAGFRLKLRAKLDETFGPDGTYGVFVRSDTNVEDLPGFTGAGLNRTVPNVVGFENLVDAIREVWASPFTERAYRWRQAHMERPEYVFPAVVVQYSFPAEKSGVLVTIDVDRGDPSWLSVAVNEGVGGAVDGQASESLRIPRYGGRVRFLAQATAPERVVLSPEGGIEYVPASGTAALLRKDEIVRLIHLAREVERFPSLRDANGAPMPADIEFAFRNGELALLQIRPFVQSRRAQASAYLRRLDEAFESRGDAVVALDAVPGAAEVGKGR